MAQTAHEVKGAACAAPALTKVGAGETAVWVHAEAERFVVAPRASSVAGCGSVAVVDGLHRGDRVVTEGAGIAVPGTLRCSTSSSMPA
jgi:hypothetical protein